MNPSPLNQNQNTNQRLRFVVFDDEYQHGEIYVNVLKHLIKPPLEILNFISSEDAWQELSRTDPDLFITDISNSGMSCQEMLEKLAERKVKYPIFVIDSSLYYNVGPVKRDWSPMLDVAFLPTPFELEKFRMALETAFKKPGVVINPAKS